MVFTTVPLYIDPPNWPQQEQEGGQEGTAIGIGTVSVPASAATAGRARGARPPASEATALRCPRCDSTNTKFCYYNNYSLSQPRHFCKTCRRYWTRGGALRNVPVGGGCRKNKRTKNNSSNSGSSASSSRPSPQLDHHSAVTTEQLGFPMAIPEFMNANRQASGRDFSTTPVELLDMVDFRVQAGQLGQHNFLGFGQGEGLVGLQQQGFYGLEGGEQGYVGASGLRIRNPLEDVENGFMGASGFRGRNTGNIPQAAVKLEDGRSLGLVAAGLGVQRPDSGSGEQYWNPWTDLSGFTSSTGPLL
ncbi:hypothetical protein AMTRI_Chr08g162760 [Amborella trichopoda]|uniref:Dof zinc finger protein n=1 Tax=Amborella trichopoda TaxID=13333 RepID=W1PJI4_AMBTC|nr:dof zinc finger protein DOF5.1 [Amborella trichopoda]ERN07821.1 hypothetical protein AMTR_s00012p00176640 [Amborella trichopoda]|eukprot:XP_006846146.1 dof zinc finger protein DOF5.1 [Amborella trichopoda]